jgi:hypothetical protein
MTPEEKARQTIDGKYQQAGWVVQDRDEMNISAALGGAFGPASDGRWRSATAGYSAPARGGCGRRFR